MKPSRLSRPLRIGIMGSVFLLVWMLGIVVYRGWLQVPEVGPGKAVTISSNDPARVTNALKESNLIASRWSFRVYLWLDRRASRVKPGGYEIAAGSSYKDIVSELIVGTPQTEVQVRVIEGWTLNDIQAELVQDYGVSSTAVESTIGKTVNRGAFAAEWRQEFPFLQALPENRSLEGYLYPDTYRVWKEQLPEALVRKQLQEFSREVAGLPLTEKSLPLKSLDEVLRLASIVEKEVPSDEDRRIVAGLFLTRLREGMPLQSDATVQYVTNSGRSRSTGKDLQIQSPFNTYRYSGLPPAPIANPSLSSIKAVLNPDIQGYRYFLTDEKGKVYYAKTLQEHAANRTKAGFNR